MKKPIFYDETGKRWVITKTLILIGSILLLSAISIYTLNYLQIWDNPYLNNLNMFFWYTMKNIFVYYIILTIVIGVARMFFLFFYSSRQQRRHKKIQQYESTNKNYLKSYRPTVTVVIPVYNEEVVIRNTIKAVLINDYPIDEILVIDDGSTDQTSAIVKKAYRLFEKVKLINKSNGGKASALNIGFQKAVGEIVITIDADTILHRQAISKIITHFKNIQVAAVSGNCKVGNRRSQLTTWQHIEYVTANNLEKRALEELNCITVVPGSNSAWRKSVVEEVGLYDDDTLAEDTDLTLKIMNAKHKIVFEERAISYEECPETVVSFIKQRYRWSYGILQSLWKNKKNIYKSENKLLKYFAIPSMLFSYLLYLTVPLIDIIFIVALFSGTKSIYLFVLFFYLTDVLNSIFAFKLEREKMKPLIWVFIQRFAYRYLIAYVTWKTLFTILKGKHVGWGKSYRTGNNTFNS